MTQRPSYKTSPTGQRILKLFVEGFVGTRDELAAKAHCHPVTAGEYIRQLHGEYIFIQAWRRARRSTPAPVWAYGFEADAAPLPNLTDTQLWQRYHAKLHEDLGQNLAIQVKKAMKTGKSAVVAQGVVIWRRGEGVNREAARRLREEPNE